MASDACCRDSKKAASALGVHYVPRTEREVRLIPAPYGNEFSHDTDGNGRRLLVPLADEQEVLRKIRDMRAKGLKLHQIARLLNEKGIPARSNGKWRAQRLSIVLRR